ncbi:hypothetical protein Pcinc_008178 [Petrolisthes cinctipes]|uniref:Uncharacterized protein n=1 Tax=Petrolisthes cinctipes TaxID=88211 RepID=A0AAE1G9E5_PETCI|nr:hypothetical protein Pcinc_019562 [Petrolisthes cinctipes]KAK3887726.1 hypothetical protein Pcinc_008178 [Petrolisthes cinctipes]
MNSRILCSVHRQMLATGNTLHRGNSLHSTTPTNLNIDHKITLFFMYLMMQDIQCNRRCCLGWTLRLERDTRY